MAERLTLTERQRGLATAPAAAVATITDAGLAGTGGMPAAKTAAAATPEDNQAAMEVIPADELDEYVDRDSGRMTVKVRGVSTDENSSSPSSEDHADGSSPRGVEGRLRRIQRPGMQRKNSSIVPALLVSVRLLREHRSRRELTLS